jgi:hypothetical protein
MADDIYGALLEVQKNLPTVAKTVENTFFKSKYADLEAVVKAVYPILHANDILVIQVPGFSYVGADGPTDALRTVLRHVPSGSEIDSTILLHKSDDSQKQGAAITYARRYALVALLGLVTEPDDDGNAASGKKAPKDDTTSERKPVAPRRKRASAQPREETVVTPETPTAIVAGEDPAPITEHQGVGPGGWQSLELRNLSHEQMVDRVNALPGDDVKAVPRKFVEENGWPLSYDQYLELDELVRMAEELGAVAL